MELAYKQAIHGVEIEAMDKIYPTPNRVTS